VELHSQQTKAVIRLRQTQVRRRETAVFNGSNLDVVMPADRDEKSVETSKSGPPARGPETVVRYRVSELLRGGREAVLEHDGADYRLRITANGRLILTK